MMRFASSFGFSLILTALASAQQPQQQPPQVEKKELFAGTISLQRPQPSKVNVGVHLWVVRGGEKHEALDLPSKGTLVVQVRAGSVTTMIGGRRQARKEGDFWTVPPGVRMGVETGQDTAILQTVLVAE